MKSLADLLPPEIAAQLHPDLLKNEADYWHVRDQLLSQYDGKWIGFANGMVIVSGTDSVKVLHEAQDSDRHPHVTCVGREFDAVRLRRVGFPYDISYATQPMPIMDVEFSKSKGTPGVTLGKVIPDTGADTSVLPWRDCLALQLDPSQGSLSVMGGIGGAKGSIVFRIWACIDGETFQGHVHADLTGGERILGRDVLNQLEILFRGPAAEVVINP